jgi:hypothetical protein
MLGEVRLDENQVVQSNLEGRVAGARSLERLLDESAEGKHSWSTRRLTTTLGLRELPDDLDHLSCRILKGDKSAAEPGSGGSGCTNRQGSPRRYLCVRTAVPIEGVLVG